MFVSDAKAAPCVKAAVLLAANESKRKFAKIFFFLFIYIFFFFIKLILFSKI